LTEPEAARLVKHYEVLAASGSPDRMAESFAPDGGAELLPEADRYGSGVRWLNPRIARTTNLR
jgi:hypothetical protein